MADLVHVSWQLREALHAVVGEVLLVTDQLIDSIMAELEGADMRQWLQDVGLQTSSTSAVHH